MMTRNTLNNNKKKHERPRCPVDLSRRVAVLLAAGFTLAMSAALVRIVTLEVSPPAPIAALLASRIRAYAEDSPRADLLDRAGRVLATSRSAWRVFVDPSKLPEDTQKRTALAHKLSALIGVSTDALSLRVEDAMARSRARARRGESPLRYARLSGEIEDARIDALRTLRENGVHVERFESRTVTPGQGLAPLVGKVGTSGAGLVGLERSQDATVQSRPGIVRMARDARGVPLWLEKGAYTPSASGEAVRLSIDLVVQRIANEELAIGVESADAAGGRVVVVDPRTGEILALADVAREPAGVVDPPRDVNESPTNTNSSMAGDDPPRYKVLDTTPPVDPVLARLRTVEDVFEPGSSFKPFVWSIITERGLLSPGDMLETNSGVYRTPYGRVIRDVAARERQTWEDVLVNSSNIGMVKGAKRLSPAQLRNAMTSFGFGSRTGAGLNTEATGLITPLSKWTKYTHTSVAFGQEVGVTTLQMARAFCVFARSGDLEGTLPRLHLLASSQDAPAELLVRVLSARTVEQARRAMRRLVERVDDRLRREGALTAPSRYTMFGKSGTPDLTNPHGSGYLKGQYVSDFIAAAPADEPALVVFVVIDDPGPASIRAHRHYGSWVAGPIVRRIVERALPYLGVAPDRQTGSETADMLATQRDSQSE